MKHNADFCVTLDFAKGSPRRVLNTASNYLDALESLDALLLQSVAPGMKCSYDLVAVESGSLKTYIKTQLEKVDDEELKRGNVNALIGPFLIRGKYACLDYLNRNNGLGSREQLASLAGTVHSLAMQSGVNQFQAYTKPPLVELGDRAARISEALQDLEEGESLAFQVEEQKVAMTRNMRILPADLEKLLVARTIPTPTRMILKVRKPDFLGSSNWEFRYNGKRLIAPINHREWLADFQNGEQEFRPGVALEVEAINTVNYGYDGDVVSETCTVEKVLRIMPKQEQLPLPF